MPKFNIYKISIADRLALINKLHSVNMEQTGSLEINGYKLEFYLSTKVTNFYNETK